MSAFSASRRILSLWLPRLPTDRYRRQMRRINAGRDVYDPAEPLVVTAKLNNALQVAALDDQAAKLGLVPQLPLATARAMHPALQIIDADDEADAAMLSAIADWCDRFTPLVALDPPHGLLLDISGCAHLFGGEAALMNALCGTLTRQGFAVSAAVAGTAVAARTLTRCVHGKIVPTGEEAAAVIALPVAALGVDEAIVRGLRRAGLKSIGDVAGRERSEITARFGAPFTAILLQALGQGDAPISPRKPVPDYVAEKRFPEPIATTDIIEATLGSLAQMLVAAMQRHGKGARQLDASFFRTDGLVRSISVQAGQAVTSAEVIARLFKERLDVLADPLDPGFGFDLIRLSAGRTVTVVPSQRGFDTADHDSEDVERLVDRLAARLGSRRVIRYAPQDTHIPEYAALAVPAQQRSADVAWPARTAGEPPLRPLRLFQRPERIEVLADFPDGPPAGFRWRQGFHRIARVEGPERIAMEWWRRREPLPQPEPDDAFARRHPAQGEVAVAAIDSSTLTRDYFRAEDNDGVRYWLYREGIHAREVATFRWFLHGLFA
jgi:protein ImuB